MIAAHRASKAGQAFEALFADIRKRLEGPQRAGASAATALAKRFVEICSQHGLGDPLVYAQWCVESDHIPASAEWKKVLEVNRPV